jgi:flagellar biosynthesis protein FlhG
VPIKNYILPIQYGTQETPTLTSEQKTKLIAQAIVNSKKEQEILSVLNELNPTSLTDAYAFIKMINAERPGRDIRIVVNVANSTTEGERTYHTLLKACQGFLKMTPPLLGIIRRDAKVREAIRSQTSLLTRYPNSEAALDVETIARRLTGT